MQNIQVTQFPGGIGSVGDNSVLQALPIPLPTRAGVVFDDFMAIAGLPTQTGYVAVSSGAAAVLATQPQASGVLRITSPGTIDTVALFGLGADGSSDPITLVVGEPVWFAARFRSDDVANLQFTLFGFGDQASIGSTSEGLQLYIVQSAVTLVAISAAGQTEVTFGTVEDNTWYEVALYWDGIDRVSGQLSDANGRIIAGGGFLRDANFPTLPVAPMIGIFEIAASAVNLDVDYIMFAAGR